MRIALILTVLFMSSCCLGWPTGPSVTPNKVEDGSNSPIAKMREHIKFSVVDKGFKERDTQARQYSDYITFVCFYENAGKKDVRAFDGRVRFTDLFDKTIFETGITISDPINAGQKQEWRGEVEYNQFMRDHQLLAATKLENMKVQWIPRAIIFADGTKMGSGE